MPVSFPVCTYLSDCSTQATEFLCISFCDCCFYLLLFNDGKAFFFSHACAIILAGDFFVKQHKSSSEVVHLCVLWIVLEISTFSGSHSPGKTPECYTCSLCSSISQVHPDTAMGRVTRANQEPVANLCCGCSPSEELQGWLFTAGHCGRRAHCQFWAGWQLPWWQTKTQSTISDTNPA